MQMTPNNSYNNRQQGNRGSYGQNARQNSGRGYDDRRPNAGAYQDAEPMVLPDEFVDLAMQTMERISVPMNGDPQRRRFQITTSKIRNLLSLVMKVYNAEHRRLEKTLLEESRLQLQMARVRMVYEAGRDDLVKQFLNESKLISYLKGIGDDRIRLIRFTQYLEALVAYHRYMGGREN